ncbi:MAG: molybdopterin-dependent oxidoreductase [Proteobacteria bacterium]|nr:molybdopterin-dependent oxidoreductase [Pseudomonadota bacterium]
MTRTTCPYCGVGCGLTIAADGSVAGDPDHPANRGRLCSKGAALADTLTAEGRLLEPQIDGRPASWDDALDRIAARFAETIAAHGPDAVAFYMSGQFLTEDYYVANKLMKGFLGSANIDTNSRLCMASSVAGHIRAFGEDVVPGSYDDLEEADLVILVGSNAAWCHPVLYQRLVAAKAARGTKIVVIDPRRTASCDIADLHLAIRPGTDVAIFAALLGHLVDRGACDHDWIQARTTGFADAVAAARSAAPSLADAAAIADIPPGALETFAAWFAATERTMTLYSQGVNQSSAGTDKVNAIINCHLATGRIGRPGTGPFSLTGQPNAMGGREVGGLANQLAAHMSFADPSDVDRVRRFWQAPYIATRPGLKAVDLFDAMLDGKVKAVWVLATNPAASMPRAERVRAALAACPFVVVGDCWPTDTTQLADVVLPAAGWSEKDGTVTNSERCISRQRAFRAPPGAARPDWWMLSEVARRMGWRAAFPYRRPAEIFREHAALSAFENGAPKRRLFDIGALSELSDDDYERLSPVTWPLPRGTAAPWSGAKRLFGDGQRFSNDDGRARLVATPYRPVAAPPDDEWPLVLNTGRLRDQWHTMTRTGRVARLLAHRREPLLEVHPADAARHCLVDGGLARVASRHGATVMPVCLSPEQRPGEVFAPMHWTDRFTSAGPIDRVVGAATDPVSGQPELKATPVRVTPVVPRWHGLLMRGSDRPPQGEFYWARVPVERGHAFTLAGWQTLPAGSSAAAWIAALLDTEPSAELVTYADPGRGTFRWASVVDGRLDACLFLARSAAALPPQEWLVPLGGGVAPEMRTGLLAGLPASAVAAGHPGATVCACFGVGIRTLQRAIATRRLASIAEIGSVLRAGTNCGSCIPELRAILGDARAGSNTAA